MFNIYITLFWCGTTVYALHNIVYVPTPYACEYITITRWH